MADIFPESREEEILVSMIDGEEYNKAPESRIEALLLELKEVIEEGGGGGGTTNYNLLQNKPSINSVTLTGDKSSADLGIPTASDLAGKQDVLPVTASGNDVAFNGDIQDGQGNTLSVLAEALTKTASGNPVVISDCAGGKARSLKTTINALQDLHGYDKPWAGGAGKNKVETPSATAFAACGITLTTADNGETTLNGTSTAGSIDGDTFELPAGTYTISVGTPLPSGIWISLDGVGGAMISPTGQSISFTTTEAISTFTHIYVNAGVAFNNFKLNWMLEEGSTATSFAPYSNICPISGRTAAVITRSDGDEISEDFTIQLGQTVYGADINWDTGVMTVLWASKAFSDIDNWNFNASYHIAYCYVTGKANGYDTIMSDSYKVVNKPYREMADGEISAVQGQDGMNVKDDRFDNLSDFMTAMGSSQLVYKLATPTTIQLTPEQLELLKGYNRVTIESGTITLDYIAKAISGNDEEIAPLVGDKATKSYAVNDFIERADGLYRVTAPIASGASFTANNTVKMSIGEALTYLYNK